GSHPLASRAGRAWLESQSLLDPVPRARQLVAVRLLSVVDEYVDEHHEIGRLEAQAVEIRSPATLPVDYVRHDAMDLIAVLLLHELVAELFGKLAGRV